MNNYEVEYRWNGSSHDAISRVNGEKIHEAHVLCLKDDIASYISDASKDAYGSRHRFDHTVMSITELDAMAARYSDAVVAAIDEEEAAHVRNIASFEANIATIIESGAGDRATALRWIREANGDDYYGDESLRYNLNLPWDYDFDHGDRDFFKREAAEKNAARAREFEIDCLEDMVA